MADLVVSGVTKSFDGRTIIEDISIEIHDRELVSLLGVSGGGKTTLFNVISGLLKPDRGQVFLDGEEMQVIPGGDWRRGFFGGTAAGADGTGAH